MTKKIFVIIFLIAGLGLFGFYYSRQRQNDLSKIYLAYAKAVHEKNLSEVLAYTSKGSLEKLRNAFETSEQLQLQDRWRLLKGATPGEYDAMFGAQVVEGDRAVLRMDHFAEPPRVGGAAEYYPPRYYDTVFFAREDGKWKIEKISSKLYFDPSPTDGSGKPIAISNFWYPQFHANHTQSPSDCKNQKMFVDKCYESWAILNLDQSLCENLLPGRQVGFYGPGMYYQCASTLAQLVGDVKLCDYDSPEFNQLRGILENQIKFCKNSLADRTFLQNTNIYLIDSDKDGLTDFQESYFNTSLANADTDRDGVFDGEEVKNDTNPLGEGKLGDHLLNQLKN